MRVVTDKAADLVPDLTALLAVGVIGCLLLVAAITVLLYIANAQAVLANYLRALAAPRPRRPEVWEGDEWKEGPPPEEDN
jgi:hypothetical protein